jgi:hypothetical protein
MNSDEFKKRTKVFALRIIRLVESLPKSKTADVIGRQLLRCGTSVGANYRAACQGLLVEANEILSIVVASIKTTRSLVNNPKSEIRNPKSTYVSSADN